VTQNQVPTTLQWDAIHLGSISPTFGAQRLAKIAVLFHQHSAPMKFAKLICRLPNAICQKKLLIFFWRKNRKNVLVKLTIVENYCV
jgi:hypothetical protein